MTQPITVEERMVAAQSDASSLATAPANAAALDTAQLEKTITIEDARRIVTHGAAALDHKKRDKTWGEKVFDWGTYGGVAMASNEVASFVIMGQFEKGKLASWKSSVMEATHTLTKDVRWIPEYFKNTARAGAPTSVPAVGLLIATIGGMTVVPIVRYLEKHKGGIVRNLDQWKYGAKSDTDPHLISAHEEMDQAPQQSWASLGKGRALTVASALGADFLFGWDKAVTTKISKNTTFQKYSSLSNISDTVSNLAVSKRFKEPVEKIVAIVKDEANTTQHALSIRSMKKSVDKGVWLLSLSSALTILFYASSKLFASRSEHKREEKIAHKLLSGESPDVAPIAESQISEERPPIRIENDLAPRTIVGEISREPRTVAPLPETSLAAHA